MSKKLVGLWNIRGKNKEELKKIAEEVAAEFKKAVEGEPLYIVAIIDLLDAYHYADIFDDERYAVVGRNFAYYAGCVKLADRLFRALNPGKETKAAWTEWEDGWDVRVYDGTHLCVYKAHSKLAD